MDQLSPFIKSMWEKTPKKNLLCVWFSYVPEGLISSRCCDKHPNGRADFPSSSSPFPFLSIFVFWFSAAFFLLFLPFPPDRGLCLVLTPGSTSRFFFALFNLRFLVHWVSKQITRRWIDDSASFFRFPPGCSWSVLFSGGFDFSPFLPLHFAHCKQSAPHKEALIDFLVSDVAYTGSLMCTHEVLVWPES